MDVAKDRARASFFTCCFLANLDAAFGAFLRAGEDRIDYVAALAATACNHTQEVTELVSMLQNRFELVLSDAAHNHQALKVLDFRN